MSQYTIASNNLSAVGYRVKIPVGGRVLGDERFIHNFEPKFISVEPNLVNTIEWGAG